MVSETDLAEPPEIPIACSLAADEVQIRVAEWQEVLKKVRERRPIDGGVRLVFEPSTPAAAVADLAAREHACCPFLNFTMPVSAEAPTLEVRGRAAAQTIIDELFGGSG